MVLYHHGFYANHVKQVYTYTPGKSTFIQSDSFKQLLGKYPLSECVLNEHDIIGKHFLVYTST